MPSSGAICVGCPHNGASCGTRGKIDSPIVFVGESPALQEIKYGKPFVGPGGDLLRKALPEGFNFDDALSLTAMRCYVPSGGATNEPRMNKALLACKPHMMEIIWQHPRKVIIPLGKWACISVLGDPNFKITQRRGELITTQDPNGAPVVIAPTYSPPFLMRGNGNLKQWRNDLANALAVAGIGTDIREGYSEPLFKTLETVEEVLEFTERLSQPQYADLPTGTDIETSGFNHRTDRILCLGLFPNHRDFWTTDPDTGKPRSTGYVLPGNLMVNDAAYKEATNRLLSVGVKFIWHNGKFDIKFLHFNGLSKARIDEDTLLLSYALDEYQGGHDLESLAKDRLGAPSYKDVLKKWAPKRSDSYEKVPPNILHDYLAKDVKNTAGIWTGLREEVRAEPDLEKLYTKTLLKATELLIRVEMRGIGTDAEYIHLNEQELGVELLQAEHELKDLVGFYVNPNSPAQVADLLWNKMGLRYKGKKPTGTDKSLLVKFKGNPVIDKIREYRTITKMLGTYVKPLLTMRDENGRIHTTYSLTRTTTGRLASKEPNIQNIPRNARYRRMFRAKPGYIFIEADYNTAELRMLAALSGDDFLVGVFQDDKRNLHDEVAISMYGPEFTEDERIRAKAINFGIPYGREAFSIAEEYNFPTSEAQRLINAWFARAPKAAAFIKQCREAPLKGQTLITSFGRKRRPGVVTPDRIHELQNEFANFFMQSTVGDICTHAGCELELDGHLERLDGGIVNLVHDSLLAEVPDNPTCIKETQRVMKKIMEGVAPKWMDSVVNFTVDMKIGHHWGLLKKVQ